MSELPQSHTHLIVARAQATRWLRKQLANGRALPAGNLFLSTGINEATNASERWLSVVEEVLNRIFDKPDYADDWHKLTYVMVGAFPDTNTRIKMLRAYWESHNSKLEGIVDRIRYIPEQLPNAQPKTTASESVNTERMVFIVHGHDEGAKESVARFLEAAGIRPIILAELPNRGQTLIEKLETAPSSYAIVLLTPDDVGAAKADAKSLKSLKARARQNVVLELGYFIGKLPRASVPAIHGWYRVAVGLSRHGGRPIR